MKFVGCASRTILDEDDGGASSGDCAVLQGVLLVDAICRSICPFEELSAKKISSHRSSCDQHAFADLRTTASVPDSSQALIRAG